MGTIPQIEVRPHRVRVAELGPAWIGIAAGVGLTILRAIRGDEYDRAILPTIAFGLIIALPGLMALMAARRRPALYLASGVVYLPLSFLSVVTLPLMFVAAMAFVAYGRHAEEGDAFVWPPLIAAVLSVLTVGTFAAMLFGGGDDPRCSSYSTSTSCTSDVITNGEALFGLAGAGLALAAGWLLSRPRERGTTT